LENKVGRQTDLSFQVWSDLEAPVVGYNLLVDIPTSFDHVGGSLEAPLVVVIQEKASLGALTSLDDRSMPALSLMAFIHDKITIVIRSDLGLSTAN
jgi:hypothetical protein